jgi:hypothetical protein
MIVMCQVEPGPENPLYLYCGAWDCYRVGPDLPILDGLTGEEYAYMKGWLTEHYNRTKKLFDNPNDGWVCDGSQTSILEQRNPGKAYFVYREMIQKLSFYFQFV